MGRKIMSAALLPYSGTFLQSLVCSFSIQVRCNILFTTDTADKFSITFLHNDTNDKFVNAHNGLALPEFVPYSILKNIHAV